MIYLFRPIFLFELICKIHQYFYLNLVLHGLNVTHCHAIANPYPDVRRRYWNAYMLFYQRISDQNSPVLPKKSRVSIMRQEAEDLSL